MSKGVQYYVQEANEAQKRVTEYRQTVKSWKFDTIAVHGMYSLEETLANQGSIAEPIFVSTSQAYRDSDEMEAGLSYQMPTWAYSRIHNPTVYYLEETLALLETYSTDLDASALCTSSGMSAIKQAIEPFLEKKDDKPINFVTPSQIYGGTYQLFNVRMPERGAVPHWVEDPSDIETWKDQIDENTRFLYAEMPTNPQQSCFDIEEVAKLAHEHGIPLIVDSTISTPALLRPIQFGADIVGHSLTKTIGSSGSAIGGAIIARHNLTSKHLTDEQKGNYAVWLKLLPFRDSGPCMSPYSAYVFLNEIKTLRIRMKHYSENAMEVVRFLKNHPKIEKIDYLGVEDHKNHNLAKKYMKLVDSDTPMFGHLMSIYIKGDSSNTRAFFDKLNLFRRATDLGRTKSIATICAISTHLQQGEEGQKKAGIPQNLVRLCIGGEDSQDIINDLKQALE
ncbi:MAG: aminotransferase class I/II-fold pyridoxal phosphate-dependent enzyme [Candidatus Peregrinibacteria bacterium]|nr:aminotransferase class I/II-fold pyridoxal phosphate-dependent enzyme [Candidatus Peregrinibacteria bacterium]